MANRTAPADERATEQLTMAADLSGRFLGSDPDSGSSCLAQVVPLSRAVFPDTSRQDDNHAVKCLYRLV